MGRLHGHSLANSNAKNAFTEKSEQRAQHLRCGCKMLKSLNHSKLLRLNVSNMKDWLWSTCKFLTIQNASMSLMLLNLMQKSEKPSNPLTPQIHLIFKLLRHLKKAIDAQTMVNFNYGQSPKNKWKWKFSLNISAMVRYISFRFFLMQAIFIGNIDR